MSGLRHSCIAVRVDVALSGGHSDWVRPPSMMMFSPVMLVARSPASRSTRSATSSAVVNRLVAVVATACSAMVFGSRAACCRDRLRDSGVA